MVTAQWAPLGFEKHAYAEGSPGDLLYDGAFQLLYGRFSPNCEKTHDTC